MFSCRNCCIICVNCGINCVNISRLNSGVCTDDAEMVDAAGLLFGRMLLKIRGIIQFLNLTHWSRVFRRCWTRCRTWFEHRSVELLRDGSGLAWWIFWPCAGVYLDHRMGGLRRFQSKICWFYIFSISWFFDFLIFLFSNLFDFFAFLVRENQEPTYKNDDFSLKVSFC